MVKLQFRKAKRTYKRKAYEYERVSLNFPTEFTEIFQALKDKEVKIAVTKQGKTYNISLTEEDS